jgi:hypothetical protein
MKKYLTILMALALAASVSAQTYTAPVKKKGSRDKVLKPPPVTNRSDVEGAIPRGLRGGNPLQMLNPKAPAQYGTAAQSLSIDPYTGKWNGIKLFEIIF